MIERNKGRKREIVIEKGREKMTERKEKKERKKVREDRNLTEVENNIE